MFPISVFLAGYTVVTYRYMFLRIPSYHSEYLYITHYLRPIAANSAENSAMASSVSARCL